MKQIYLTIKKYLQAFKGADGLAMFPTVRINTGDYERLRSTASNKDDNSVDFLTLLHYTNVDYALSTEQIFDGNGILWVSVVYDSEPWLEETFVFDLVDIVVGIVLEAKKELIGVESDATWEEVNDRPITALDLEMVDFPQSFETIGLLRMGFRVLFKDATHYIKKDHVNFTGIVNPPFVQPSDDQDNPFWAGKDDDRTNDDAAQYADNN